MRTERGLCNDLCKLFSFRLVPSTLSDTLESFPFRLGLRCFPVARIAPSILSSNRMRSK